MCGRFALYASEKEIVTHFGLRTGFCMRARYNTAPGHTILLVTQEASSVAFGRWGFLAPWVKKTTSSLPSGHINARMESLQEKPTFREAYASRRCLIPASGYYEWKTLKGKKHPFYFSFQEQPLVAFAGLWSLWQDETETVMTCAIVTQEAPEAIAHYHSRMPVVLSKDAYSQWLSSKREVAVDALTLSSETLRIWPVTFRVNNPQFEEALCVHPL